MALLNKTCQVTNKSNAPVLVLNAFNQSSDSTKVGYAQTLKIIYAEDKEPILAKNTTNTICLDRMQPNPSQPGSTMYCILYDLIFAEPKTLFPVQNTVEMLNFMENVYPAITVQEANRQKMKLALQFYQTISAYPSSNLAKEFCQIVKASLDKSKSIADATATINQFFSSIKPYKLLDYSSYTILASYLQNYANIWACNQESYTYYFYNANSASSATFSAPVYQGKLIFKKKCHAAIANPEDTNGGYSILYHSPAEIVTEIFYNNGQFVSSSEDAIPAICLQGTFILQSQFTNRKTDTYIIPILCGSIYNEKVLGTYAQQQAGHSTWYDFWHPSTLSGWISLILQLFGMVQLIHFIIQLFTFFIKKLYQFTARKKQALSEEEVAAIRDNTETHINDILLKEQQALLKRLDDTLQLPTEEDLDTHIQQLREFISGQMALKRATLQQDILKSESNQLSELASYGVNEPLELTANTIFQASETLNKNMEAYHEALEQGNINNIRDLGKTLANVVDHTQTLTDQISESLSTIRKSFSTSLSSATQSSIEASNRAMSEANEVQQKIEKGNSEVEEGDIDEDIDYLDWEVAL